MTTCFISPPTHQRTHDYSKHTAKTPSVQEIFYAKKIEFSPESTSDNEWRKLYSEALHDKARPANARKIPSTSSDSPIFSPSISSQAWAWKVPETLVAPIFN